MEIEAKNFIIQVGANEDKAPAKPKIKLTVEAGEKAGAGDLMTIMLNVPGHHSPIPLVGVMLDRTNEDKLIVTRWAASSFRPANMNMNKYVRLDNDGRIYDKFLSHSLEVVRS